MPNQRPPETSPIDSWMRQTLAEQYAGTLREPIPEALRKLLDEGER